MATVACEVHHADPRFDWTGFYRVTAPELLKIAVVMTDGEYNSAYCNGVISTVAPRFVAYLEAVLPKLSERGLIADVAACFERARAVLFGLGTT